MTRGIYPIIVYIPQNCSGDPRHGTRHGIFDMQPPIHPVWNRADALQISWKFYSSNLAITSDKLTPKALAILAQVKIVGTRLWFSIKLIAGRLNPVISANLSCEMPCSLRNRMNSSAIFSTSISNDLSLITDNSHGLALNLKRNYSYHHG